MTRAEEREVRRRRLRHVLLVPAVLGILLIFGSTLWTLTTVVHQSGQIDDLTAGKKSATQSLSAVAPIASSGQALGQSVNVRCQSKAFRAQNAALCAQASQLATAKPSLIPGPQGPGPSDDQVRRVIADLLPAYFAVNPPPVDYTKLLAFVNTQMAAYFRAHPSPGPVGASGSPGPAGSVGASGQSGQPGASGSPGVNGSDGPQGPAGASITGVSAAQDGATVAFTFTLSNGTALPPVSVQLPVPNGCPRTSSVVVRATTVPPNVLGPTVGNQTTIAVCVPR